MKRKKYAKWLSVCLAAAMCVSGPLTMIEAEAATATVADPMKEVLAEERVEEYLEEETEDAECGEIPEDFSWMDTMFEEDAEKEKMEEAESGDAALVQNGEPLAETASPDTIETEGENSGSDPQSTEIFGETDQDIWQTEENCPDDMEVFQSPVEFQDGDISQLYSASSELTEQNPDVELFTAGEDTNINHADSGNASGSVFSDGQEKTETEDNTKTEDKNGTDSIGDGSNPGITDGEETKSEDDLILGESEATLVLKEGEDFVERLNILLYKAKDLATDDHPYKVIIPPGNYEIKGTISMYSNMHLYAVGAVMKKTSTKKQILLRLGNTEISEGGYNGYRNITIEGGTWDCNYESCANKEADGGFVGFRIGHATNVTIKNATFLNNLKSHFIELGGVKHALITGCKFEGYWTPHETTGQECIQIDTCLDEIFPRYQPFDGTVCTDIVIEKNLFQNVFAGAGSHSMVFNKPYTKIIVRNNTFKNVKKRAVWFLNCKDSEISGNTMTNVGSGIYVSPMRQTHAHLLSGQTASSKQNQYSENVVVSKNKITLAKPCNIAGVLWRGYGVYLGGQEAVTPTYPIPKGDYVLRGVTVTGNTIKGYANGIHLARTASCKVTKNTISLSNPGAFTSFGIYLGGSRNNEISGNVVSGASNIGIYIYTTSSYKYGSTGNKVVSNQVKSCASDGIRISAGSHSTSIDKNICTSNKKYGIEIHSSTITSMTYNKAITNAKYGIYCYSSTIKLQKKNTLQANKGTYAIYFSKCKGQVQNVKNFSISTVKSTTKTITGTATGGSSVYVYVKSNSKKLGSARISKNWKYTVPIKAQKKGTVLLIKVYDKYGNAITNEKKVA